MKVPKISDSEWEVMKVLWDQSPLSANDIAAGLNETKWSLPTIRTLIGRLVQKKALRFEKAGREYLYSPCFSRDECTRHERRSFLRRVYDGALNPLLAGLLDDEDLSQEEIESLYRMLDKKRKGKK